MLVTMILLYSYNVWNKLEIIKNMIYKAVYCSMFSNIYLLKLLRLISWDYYVAIKEVCMEERVVLSHWSLHLSQLF